MTPLYETDRQREAREMGERLGAKADIYGQRLRSGYCEVHPDVPEPYPCSICHFEGERAEGQRLLDAQYEQAMWDAQLAEYEQEHMAGACVGLS